MPKGYEVSIEVKYTEGPGTGLFDEKMKELMFNSAIEMQEIMTFESKQRPDGLGNPDGAVDLGELSTIQIFEQDDDHFIVGTMAPYAVGLALGLPDPSASLGAIRDWRRRKNIPRRAQQIYDKITTEGPIPNPFHERTIEKFMDRWPFLVEEVKF